MVERKDQFWRIVIFSFLAVGLFVFALPVCGIISALAVSAISGSPTDLRTRFRLFSDIELPASAHVIFSDDGERSLNGDGVFSAIFDINDSDLNLLLKSSPFGGTWEAGPVPAVVKDHFFENDFKRKAPWNATNVTITAQNRGPKDMPWHNGRIFIVDRNARRVWFGEWDY